MVPIVALAPGATCVTVAVGLGASVAVAVAVGGSGVLVAVGVGVAGGGSGVLVGGFGVRVGVAGAVGVAGVVGLTRATTPRPLPENIDYNRRQREQWQREVDRVTAENASRRAAARLQIRAGVAAPVKTR